MAQTDSEGHDLGGVDNVRYYLLSSLPHGAGNGPGICAQPRNPLRPNAALRALLTDLDAWVSKDTAPPADRLPRIADGTLVPPLPQHVYGFPNIPGVVYNGLAHTGDLWDFGPDFDKGLLTVLPPKLVGTPYPVYVPKADADGNDIAGVRLPDVTVPVATFTGWALRADGLDGCDAAGQRLDFAKTKAERLAAGDPRPSLEERYPGPRRLRRRRAQRRRSAARSSASCSTKTWRATWPRRRRRACRKGRTARRLRARASRPPLPTFRRP